MATFSPTELAERAVAALDPEGKLLTDPDPALIGQSLVAAGRGLLRSPFGSLMSGAELGLSLLQVGAVTASRALGASLPGPIAVDASDRRFADPTWEENPAFFALRQSYLAVRNWVMGLLDQAGLDDVFHVKAELALSVLADGLAPTNFLLTNPAALKRAFETGGKSVVAGLRNFGDDLINNKGRPRQVDTSPFEVGRNMAVTPGKVVYRSHLIEVIQYLPQTETVHEVPVLCSPPWINKYYVMDLAPDRSLIEWMVQHGRTVFAISYRNPDASMSDTDFGDYLVDGPCAALDVVCEITGATKVDMVGVCLGGATAVMTAAYLAQNGDDRIASITLINTMIDYSNPGALGIFTDPETVDKLAKKMARKGYLEASEMAGTFDMLRPNDLIFNYVVNNWLMGQNPPAFDILAWNADSTRMPAKMHSTYLRSCYVNNELVRGELVLADRQLNLADVKQDIYIVAAINDHIVPWESSYATTQHVPGNVRFVLSSGGHIAGIINPPGPKAWLQAAPGDAATPEEWKQKSERQSGSWWDDWVLWSGERAGALVKPPRMGSKKYPVLGDAPGEYVIS